MTQVCPFLGFSPVPSLMSRYWRPLSVLVIFFPFALWPGSSARPPADATRAKRPARAARRSQRIGVIVVVMGFQLLVQWRVSASFRQIVLPSDSLSGMRVRDRDGPDRTITTSGRE